MTAVLMKSEVLWDVNVMCVTVCQLVQCSIPEDSNL